MPFVLPLAVLMILAAGCPVFIVCASVPMLRRFALGGSFLFAAAAVLTSAVLFAYVLGVLALDHLAPAASTRIGASLERHHVYCGYFAIAAVLGGSLLLSIAHGFLIRRLTLPLFQLYVSGVAIGVGLLTFLAIWIGAGIVGWHNPMIFSDGFILLGTPLLAWHCFRHASEFRGSRPERFQPVMPEEYAPQ